jgi:PAS domain S-box-containing protein
MQSGLDDYVLKSPNRYFRLPAAVRVALERAQTERRAALLEIRLQSLLNQLDIGIFRSTTDGQLLESNPAFLRLLGVNSLPEAQAMDLLNLPELGAQYRATLSFQPQEREVQLHRADGTSIWTALNITFNQIDDETVVDGLLEDITARKQAQAEIRQLNETLEQRVRERTQELEVVNQDLEAFAYSVSHDLREPLRSIQGLAQALLEDYAQALNSVGQSYSQGIVNISQQMDEFIEDLLIYSRLRREEIPIQPIDLGAVVTEALQQLEAEIRQRQAQLIIEEPLPEVMGNRLLLMQVLKNLLSNAVKFVVPGQQPEVRVWAEETERREESKIRLWVEDKGIGIDVQNQKRIFYVFERLHGSEIYPGTGIGLAIVRKGVERMGGQVGVESQLGQGSRFWIELPKVPEL